MPVDYSKWRRRNQDALELSDDSDIEVHPNVDKRSFIRAKQHQIHQERLLRKREIEKLEYERVVNDGLLKRISALLASLKARSSEAERGKPGEVAFRAVMESAGKPEDDRPPQRPEGLEGGDVPTYSKMLVALLDQVNKSLDEMKAEDRYAAMLAELEVHEGKVQQLQRELEARLEELHREEKKKITSEDIHTGFDSSHVNKSKPSDAKAKPKSHMELLNPQVLSGSSGASPQPSPSLQPGEGNQDAIAAAGTREDEDEDDADMEASPEAKQFARITPTDYGTSLAFLSQHSGILTEHETDGILVLAFDAALEGKDDIARQCVHQALLLQYCRALGKDGVALFFKRITTKGHQAQEVFYKDVQETYGRIWKRAHEILAERAKGSSETTAGGVEQIQLHAVEPGTRIQIRVPPADSQDVEDQRARRIFDDFKPEMKAALESGQLEEVNKVLGTMKVDEAEELVNQFGEANILSLEEQLIDATTEDGQRRLQEMKEEAAAAALAGYDEDEEDVVVEPEVGGGEEESKKE